MRRSPPPARAADDCSGPSRACAPGPCAEPEAGPPSTAAPSSAPAAAVNAAGGSCVDQAKAIFEGPDGRRDEGVKIDVVVQQLNGRFTEAQVREAVEHLVNEGHLYSTIDDDHFKSTNL